jgi:hypothetical protein
MVVRAASVCFSRPATTVSSPAPRFIYQRGRAPVVFSYGPFWAPELAAAVVVRLPPELAAAVVVVRLPQAAAAAVVVGLPQLAEAEAEAFHPSELA